MSAHTKSSFQKRHPSIFNSLVITVQWLIETEIDFDFLIADLETNKLIKCFSITFGFRSRQLSFEWERYWKVCKSWYFILSKLLTSVSVYRIIKLLIFTLVKQLDKWIPDCWAETWYTSNCNRVDIKANSHSWANAEWCSAGNVIEQIVSIFYPWQLSGLNLLELRWEFHFNMD